MSGPSATPVFEVLADPTRRRVVELLAQGPRAGRAARRRGRHVAAGDEQPPAGAARGRVVADGRLPDDAGARLFRLRPQSFTALQAWLDQLQAEWRVQLGSFKRHVEGKTR